MTDDTRDIDPLELIRELVAEGKAAWEPGGNGHKYVRMKTGALYRIENDRPVLVEE